MLIVFLLKVINCDWSVLFNNTLQIKCSPDLNVDIQSAVEFTVGDGTRNIERTIYDDMSDAESDPDDEYEEEEGDEIMLEFMSTN